MNKNIILIIYLLSLFSCKSENNRNDNGVTQHTQPSFEAQVDTTSKIDRSITLFPCHGVLNIFENLSGLAQEKNSVHDWTHGNVFLSPTRGPEGKWYRKNFSTKTINYNYKDSIFVYLHFYKHIKEEGSLDVEKIIKDLNNKILSRTMNTKLAERVLIYFIEETSDHDVIVIDIPPNWNSSYELREEFKQKLLEAFDCTYLICDRGRPCVFKNTGGATN